MSRPIETFHGFCGQRNLVKMLCIQCHGVKELKKPFPHLLLGGSSGMGKTKLAKALSQEMDVGFHEVLASKEVVRSELVRVLMGLKANDFLFVDEIHALTVDCQQMLYPAMDGKKVPKLDPETERFVEGQWTDVAAFTLVAASDQHGKLATALHRRISLQITLADYSREEMRQIVFNYAQESSILLSPQAASVLAAASRGVPRRVRHLMDTLRNFVGNKQGDVSATVVNEHLRSLGIDEDYLTEEDRKCLVALAGTRNAMSLSNLATSCGLDPLAFERDVQPWLIRQKLIGIGTRGRFLTDEGRAFVQARGLR